MSFDQAGPHVGSAVVDTREGPETATCGVPAVRSSLSGLTQMASSGLSISAESSVVVHMLPGGACADVRRLIALRRQRFVLAMTLMVFMNQRPKIPKAPPG